MTDDACDVVAALWERFLPLVRSRIDVIERFLGGDGAIQREDAERAAHNLTGVLGSYGRHDGSQIARRIEHAVRSGDHQPPRQLTQDLAALRAALE